VWEHGIDGIGSILADDVEFAWWSGDEMPCRGRESVLALLNGFVPPESRQLPALTFEDLRDGVVLASDASAAAAAGADGSGLAVVIYSERGVVTRMVQYDSAAHARGHALDGDAGSQGSEDERVWAAVDAIHAGDIATLERLLRELPELATLYIRGNGSRRMGRTLLHVVTDWPGHFPAGARSVAVLVRAGADVNARFSGRHRETPLHWAASTDDVEVLDALLDAGADINADGAVIGNGTALSDATAFGQWNVARRLVERGARVGFGEAASLGLLDVMRAHVAHGRPSPEALTSAFWMACHGSQREAAAWLLERGAELNWVGFDGLTPLDAADRSGATDLVEWLRGRGGISANADSAST
jgi:uncharacterized protein